MSATRVILDHLRAANISWRTATRLSRTLLAVTGATAGAALLTAAAAQAVTGSEPGNLSLNPASGAATLKPTWSTTDGCPTGYQTSAVLAALNAGGSFGSYISPTVASPTSAFSGTLLGNIASVLSLGTNVRPGQASEFVVYCFSGVGGTGSRTPVQTTEVALSATGSSYTASAGASGSSKAATPVWHRGWFDIGLGVVAIGLVIALAGLLRAGRRRSRPLRTG